MGRNFIAWLVAFLGLGSAAYTGLIPVAQEANPYESESAKISSHEGLLSSLQALNETSVPMEVARYHRAEQLLSTVVKRAGTLSTGYATQLHRAWDSTRYIDGLLADESNLLRLHGLKLSVLVPVLALSSPRKLHTLSKSAAFSNSEHWRVALALAKAFQNGALIQSSPHSTVYLLSVFSSAVFGGAMALGDVLENLENLFPSYGPWISGGVRFGASALFGGSMVLNVLQNWGTKRRVAQAENELEAWGKKRSESVESLFSATQCEDYLRGAAVPGVYSRRPLTTM